MRAALARLSVCLQPESTTLGNAYRALPFCRQQGQSSPADAPAQLPGWKTFSRLSTRSTPAVLCATVTARAICLSSGALPTSVIGWVNIDRAVTPARFRRNLPSQYR